MKFSLIITVLIVAIAALFGFDYQSRIEKLEIECEDLILQGTALEIPTGMNESFSLERTTQRMRREAREKLISEFVGKLTEFLKEPEGKERGDELIASLLGLSTSELEMLAHEVKADPNLEKEQKQELIQFVVMMLSVDFPLNALDLISETREVGAMDGKSQQGRNAGHVLEVSVARLAQKDPLAASDWIKKNRDLVGKRSDSLLNSVIREAGQQDYGLALSLLNDLEADREKDDAIATMGMRVTADRADEFFDALLGYGATPKQKASALVQMSNGAFMSDFETASGWLAGSKLTDEEKRSFVGQLWYGSINKNPGKWMTWLYAQKEKSTDIMKAEQNFNLIQRWTLNDFVAAGEWVGKLPEGESRNEAVTHYASTLASSEPAAAAEWAVTLPDGEAKVKVLQSIYQGYQKKSPEAAAIFAEKHGLETPEAVDLKEAE